MSTPLVSSRPTSHLPSRLSSPLPVSLSARLSSAWPYTLVATASLVAALLTQPAMAQPSGQGQPGQMPPPEALAACQSLASGQACSFSGQRGNATGTCWAPEGKPLACKPAGAPNASTGNTATPPTR